MAYFISFSEENLQGSVNGLGFNPTTPEGFISGQNDTKSELQFDTFEKFQEAAALLGFNIDKDPAIQEIVTEEQESDISPENEGEPENIQ